VRLNGRTGIGIDLYLIIVEIHLLFSGNEAVALRKHIVKEEWAIGVALKEVRVDGLVDVVLLDIALGHLIVGTLHITLG